MSTRSRRWRLDSGSSRRARRSRIEKDRSIQAAPKSAVRISEATFYVGKKRYAGPGMSELRRLKLLEDENTHWIRERVRRRTCVPGAHGRRELASREHVAGEGSRMHSVLGGSRIGPKGARVTQADLLIQARSAANSSCRRSNTPGAATSVLGNLGEQRLNGGSCGIESIGSLERLCVNEHPLVDLDEETVHSASWI